MTNNWGHNKDNQKLRRIQYVMILSEEVSFIILLRYLSLSAHALIKEYLRLAGLS